MMIRNVLFTFAAACMFGLAATPSGADGTRALTPTIEDSRAISVEATKNRSGRRIALVIGNAHYTHAKPLDNPGNDALKIASAFSQYGFILVGGKALLDLDKRGLEEAIRQFGQDAKGADVALVYYAGHGIQMNGINFLIPTTAGPLRDPTDVDFEFISVDLLMKQLEYTQSLLRVVILDACRNNPFEDSSGRAIVVEGAGTGLAEMRAPSGTLIGFATGPGKLSSDGSGDNSPYAIALVNNLRPGVNLFNYFNQVGNDVMAATKEKQQPWQHSSPIKGIPYLIPPAVAIAPPVVNEAPSGDQVASIAHEPSQIVSSGSSIPLTQEAISLLGKRNFAAAHVVLDRAIELDPDSAAAYRIKGFAFGMRAKELAAAALKAPSPESIDIAKAMFRKAWPYFDRAIELDTYDSPARRQRGDLVMEVYKFRMAIQDLNKAGQQNLLKNAIRDLRDAVVLDPTSVTAPNSLGIAYLYNRDPVSAIESFSKAIALKSSYASPYAGRCTAYVMLGLRNEAIANAKVAAKIAEFYRDGSCLKRIVGAF
jgi:hypothetical protein